MTFYSSSTAPTCKTVAIEPDPLFDGQLLGAGGATLVEGAETSVEREDGRRNAGGVLTARLLQIAEVHSVGAGHSHEVLVAEALEAGGAVGGTGASVLARVVLARRLGRPTGPLRRSRDVIREA